MSIKEEVLNFFSDKKWHCCVCAPIGTSQIAAQVRDLRKDGYKFEEPTPNRFCEWRYCEVCKRMTIHRRLV